VEAVRWVEKGSTVGKIAGKGVLSLEWKRVHGSDGCMVRVVVMEQLRLGKWNDRRV